MSATSKRSRRSRRPAAGPRADDPRVVRTRAAVVDAARTLFLRDGYTGTTMEDIAALAGLAKRTVYNNYADKSALFTQIVADVIATAEAFARTVHEEFVDVTAENLHERLDDLARRMVEGILRPEVIALRRLLIAEARSFPTLGKEYFDRAPGRVIGALASDFERLRRRRLLRAPDGRCAATQFAYLVVGEPLDRAMLAGTMPASEQLIRGAREGVETFLARYGHARAR